MVMEGRYQEQLAGIQVPGWLSVPTIFHDEIAVGYIARLLAANGIESHQVLFEKLRYEYPHQASHSKTPLLAWLCELSLEKFVCLHTMEPYRRAIVQGSHLGLAYKERGLLLIPKSLASFCPDCVKEEVSYCKIAYWHRIHQIPGVDWCPKHGVQLESVKKQFMSFFPENIFGPVIRKDRFSLFSTSSPVARYMDIASCMLNLEFSIGIHSLQYLILSITKQIGQQLKFEGKRSLISDLAMETCPRDWLIRLIPAFKNKRLRKSLAMTDSLGRCGGSQEASLLALALLFSSAEEAMQHLWTIDQIAAVKALPKPEEITLDFWESIQCALIYLRHKGNENKIAKDIGLPSRQVKISLRKAGLHQYLFA